MPELQCFDDLDQFGAECPDALEELRQDLYHRLIEPYGSNIDDPDRGLGLEDMLSGPLDSGLKQKIENELRKDARVTDASAVITQIDESSFQIAISVVADEGELGLTLLAGADGTVTQVS